MGKITDAILIKGLPATDARNANKVNLWALLWAATLVLSLTMQEMQIIQGAAMSVAIASLNLAVGMILVISYRRMLITLDEMERRIQYNALASAVAASLLVYGVNSILSNVALTEELSSSEMIMILSLTYCVSLIAGRVRMA